MAKATTIKDALKKIEETRGVNPAEVEKASSSMNTPVVEAQRREAQHARMQLLRACGHVQVELWGQCPPIEKMDATLSTLKACK
jgi:hypothetical protein